MSTHHIIAHIKIAMHYQHVNFRKRMAYSINGSRILGNPAEENNLNWYLSPSIKVTLKSKCSGVPFSECLWKELCEPVPSETTIIVKIILKKYNHLNFLEFVLREYSKWRKSYPKNLLNLGNHSKSLCHLKSKPLPPPSRFLWWKLPPR